MIHLTDNSEGKMRSDDMEGHKIAFMYDEATEETNRRNN